MGNETYKFDLSFIFEAPTLTDAILLGQAVNQLMRDRVDIWNIKVRRDIPSEKSGETVYKNFGFTRLSETYEGGKMVHCLLVSCNEDFNPKKSTDIPKTGQVLLRYPWTGAKAAAEALAANRYRVKGGTGSDLIGNIWVVLYIADKQPDHGEVLQFEPLKNVMRLNDPEEKE